MTFSDSLWRAVVFIDRREDQEPGLVCRCQNYSAGGRRQTGVPGDFKRHAAHGIAQHVIPIGYRIAPLQRFKVDDWIVFIPILIRPDLQVFYPLPLHSR